MKTNNEFCIDILSQRNLLRRNHNIFADCALENNAFSKYSRQVLGISQSIDDMKSLNRNILEITNKALQLVSVTNDNYKQILVMRYTHKYSVIKISQILHFSERTFYNLIEDAKKLYSTYFTDLLNRSSISSKNSDRNSSIDYKKLFSICYADKYFMENIVSEAIKHLKHTKNGTDKVNIINLVLKGKNLNQIEKTYSCKSNLRTTYLYNEGRYELLIMLFGVNAISQTYGFILNGAYNTDKWKSLIEDDK